PEFQYSEPNKYADPEFQYSESNKYTASRYFAAERTISAARRSIPAERRELPRRSSTVRSDRIGDKFNRGSAVKTGPRDHYFSIGQNSIAMHQAIRTGS
ncbi:MAG: hypothetical protein Q4G69_11305, partial [Planctomycetia bacterium]|nr:hypothetical protein [Planctomycetia bacterium]